MCKIKFTPGVIHFEIFNASMYLLLCDYQGQCFVLYDHAVTIECHEQKLSRLTDFSAFKNICYSLN